jgi:hypothetical protein
MDSESFAGVARKGDVFGGATELLDTVGFYFDETFSFVDEHSFPHGKDNSANCNHAIV